MSLIERESVNHKRNLVIPSNWTYVLICELLGYAHCSQTAHYTLHTTHCTINKDHQRMMVDPMFMIVQNVRSFLTAVTPTAVGLTAVIY